MAVIVAFAVACACTPLIARVAVRLGVVDHPGPLKVQREPVPYLGGIAVLLGLAIPVALSKPTLLIPLGGAALLGLLDDIGDISARIRLVAEVAIGAAAAAVLPTRGVVGALVTIAFVVVLCNAVNLLDGLDGLACGVAALSAVGFAIVLDGDTRVLALALAGALVGVLVWNRPPARIYLGDAGSYLVGTTLALLLASAFGTGESVALASGAILFVGVPVADAAVAIFRRLRAHRPLFQGDRGHVYDQLVDRGWTATAATGACIAMQAVLTAVGIGITYLAAGAAVAATATVVAVVAIGAFVTFTTPATWTRELE